jgi:PAS domain-containing protein
VIGVMLPIEVDNGVIFDPRSVVLSMAGLLGGPLVGVAVIIACTSLGLAYRYAHQRGWLNIGLLNLLLFGFIVVLLFTQPPHGIVETMMGTVAIPLVPTFTPATALLGLLLNGIENRMQTTSALRASEASLSLHLENTPLAAISWDENFRCTR